MSASSGAKSTNEGAYFSVTRYSAPPISSISAAVGGIGFGILAAANPRNAPATSETSRAVCSVCCCCSRSFCFERDSRFGLDSDSARACFSWDAKSLSDSAPATCPATVPDSAAAAPTGDSSGRFVFDPLGLPMMRRSKKPGFSFWRWLRLWFRRWCRFDCRVPLFGDCDFVHRAAIAVKDRDVVAVNFQFCHLPPPGILELCPERWRDEFPKRQAMGILR